MRNVLKLLRCFWKQPIPGHRDYAINLYILYERENYEGYAEVNEWRTEVRYEDSLDLAIRQRLYEQLRQLSGVDEVHVVTHSDMLWPGFEHRTRALYSRIAYGWTHTDIAINTQTQHVINLATRIFFADRPQIEHFVTPALPLGLELDYKGEVFSLHRANFFSPEHADEVIMGDYEGI